MINVAVEGESDRGAVAKLLQACGLDARRVIVRNGSSRLDAQIPAYNRAAVHAPWLVVRDSDGECPVQLRRRLLKEPQNDAFSLRIAATMIEAWLMADHEAFARHFRLRPGQVPALPENLPHAKRAALAIFAGSTSATMRRELVSEDMRFPGPLYVRHLNEYAIHHWRPFIAADRAPTLARAIDDIRRLAARGTWPSAMG